MGKDKASKKTRPPAATAGTAPSTPPSWPPFRPSLPVATLEIDFPVPALADKIALIHKFWPKSLCRNYITFLESLPLTLTPGRPKKGEAVRVNDRFQVQDPGFAQKLWLETGLRDVVLNEQSRHLWGGDVIGLNSNIRVYRYCKGHFFDSHCKYIPICLRSSRPDVCSTRTANYLVRGPDDDANLVTLKQNEGVETPGKTTWTLLLYLTEDCVGGETVFYPRDREVEKEAVVVSPEAGMVLLHKHGDDCLLHAGREVLQGVKWILRTDLVVRR